MTGQFLYAINNNTRFHSIWNPDLSFLTDDRGILEKNIRFPIPTNEIIGNKALDNSNQNFGYSVGLNKGVYIVNIVAVDNKQTLLDAF